MSTAPQRQGASVGATRNVGVSFSGELDSGELLTGTPTITEDATSDLTITNKVINTAILELNGISVPIGEAVQCTVLGFVSANFPYTLNITVSTDATPAQVLPGKIIIVESK
ncbi:MAG: hypothetical protein ABUJ92_00325 [Desulfobacterales bacterium]